MPSPSAHLPTVAKGILPRPPYSQGRSLSSSRCFPHRISTASCNFSSISEKGFPLVLDTMQSSSFEVCGHRPPQCVSGLPIRPARRRPPSPRVPCAQRTMFVPIFSAAPPTNFTLCARTAPFSSSAPAGASFSKRAAYLRPQRKGMTRAPFSEAWQETAVPFSPSFMLAATRLVDAFFFSGPRKPVGRLLCQPFGCTAPTFPVQCKFKEGAPPHVFPILYGLARTPWVSFFLFRSFHTLPNMPCSSEPMRSSPFSPWREPVPLTFGLEFSFPRRGPRHPLEVTLFFPFPHLSCFFV